MPLDPMPDWVPTRRRAFGDHLRTLRCNAHLSQLELGERIGRDHKTIHRWETAATEPALTDLFLIADALGIPAADLLR